MEPSFLTFSPAHVRALIENHPLAWVLPRATPDGPTAPAAVQLPLLGEFDAAGALTGLVGHLSRRSPLLPALAPGGPALMLFSGPQAYVSPSHAGLRDWGPTWNYAQLSVECELDVSAEHTEDAISRLVAAMEPEGAGAWRAGELGGRYAAMRERIIGFHARVTRVCGRFKLGQDEKPDVLENILASHPDAELVEWMRWFSEGDG